MRLHYILLLSDDPEISTEFYRRLFGHGPRIQSSDGDGYVEFRFGATTLAIRGTDRNLLSAHDLEATPSSRGWGAFFVFSVDNFDQIYARARAAGFTFLDGEFNQRGKRYFALKDPSGYVLEISEERIGANP
jgi:catechol 2,3-dioxygenase-like lactoylglutathione lyase family enzyme